MATSIEAIVDEEIKCGICHERMNDPKILVCLHSFCRGCLQRLIFNSGSVLRCPLCNTEMKRPPNGVDDFKTNFTLRNLKEALSFHEKSQQNAVKCGNGIDENRGVARCVDCDCYLCLQCCETHSKLRATRNHQVVPLAEIRNDVRKYDSKRFCKDHPKEELAFFCEHEEDVICRDCALVTHKEHKYSFIRDVQDQLKQKLQEDLRDIEEKSEEFSQHLKHINEVKLRSDENVEACHQEIIEYFNRYIESVREKQQQLIEWLRNKQGIHSKQISEQELAVSTSKAKLVSGKEFGTCLVEKSSPVDVAMLYKLAHDRLVSLKDENWDSGLARATQWKFLQDGDPFKCKFSGGINRRDIVIEDLAQPTPPPYENTFSVQLNTECDTSLSKLNVKIINVDTGVQIDDVHIERAGNRWNIKYSIQGDGKYFIYIHIDGVEAEESPFVKEWCEKLTNGVRVKRGKDWKWGEQDGGKYGTVMGWAGDVGASNNWVRIKWDNSTRQNNYRWGAEGAFDLEVVPQ